MGAALSIEDAIKLVGHLAWPFVALVALVALRPYIAQIARAAADLRDLLNRSGEMVHLVAQISALNEATSDLKAMQDVALASRPDPTPAAGPAELESLWQQLEQQWRETRDSFRAVAQSAGLSVSFIGTVGVRDAAKALAEKGVISDATARAMTDLSAQYQYMYRTTTARSEYLNENVLVAYTNSATRVRNELKSAR